MGRIDKFYVAEFSRLLHQAGTRELERGLQRLFATAERLTACHQISRSVALAPVYARLRRRLLPPVSLPPEGFFCDAGLGGLARWLRAAGYEAVWRPELDDAEAIREARRLGATLLTTDTLMMERAILRDGIVPSLWVSPRLSVPEQVKVVFEAFDLELGAPRCMACGGPLQAVDKARIADRIPPRTRRWLDEYFACAQCGRLFWHGTHWEKIRRRLRGVVG